MMRLYSEAVDENNLLDKRYCCDDTNSIPLTFEVPQVDEVATLALTLQSQCEEAKALWVVYKIPPHIIGLPSGVPPAASFGGGIFQGFNDYEGFGYKAPCFEQSGCNRFRFTLYALGSKLEELPPGLGFAQLLEAISPYIYEKTHLDFSL